MKKNAQLSMFIIVGLIVLLGALLAVAIYSDVLEFKPPEEQQRSELETELQPLSFAIQECQQRLASEAAKIILSNGGYLNPEEAGVFSTLPPAGTGVELYEDKALPYWHHVQDGRDRSEQPQLTGAQATSIASQIAGYVDERIDDCVPWSNFGQYTIERAEPSSDVTFTDQTTRVETSWDMSVETSIGTKRYDAHEASVDAPVKHLYELGDEVNDVLVRTNLPEQSALRWLAVYATGETSLPPMYGGMDMGYSYDIWPIPSAKDELMDVLGVSADSIQHYGSEAATLTFTDNEAVNNLQLDNLLITERDATDTRIRFVQPLTTEPYFSANDNIGVAIPGITKIPVVGPFLPRIVDNTFMYDLSYPLVVRLEKNGYELQFGYEANIENNRPLESAELEEPQGSGYCESPGGAELTLRVNPSVRSSALYACGEQTCPVGDVIDGELRTTLPSCAEGTLEVTNEDYFSESQSLSSSAGENIELTMQLYEPRETRVLLQAYHVTRIDEEYGLSSTTSPVDAQAIFIRQGTPYVARATSGETIELVPGTYDIIVINNTQFDPPVEIPEETRCLNTKVLNLNNCDEKVTINATQFDALPTVFADYTEDQAVTISSVPAELTINAVRLRTTQVGGNPTLPQIQNYDDVGYINALFDLEDELEPRDILG